MLAFGARCTYLYRYTCTLHQRFICGQKKAFPVPYYWVVNRLKLVFVQFYLGRSSENAIVLMFPFGISFDTAHCLVVVVL